MVSKHKTYKFAVHNWKSGARAFWLYKDFPSEFAADRYAMRLSFGLKTSPYMVVFTPQAEHGGYQVFCRADRRGSRAVPYSKVYAERRTAEQIAREAAARGTVDIHGAPLVYVVRHVG